jgi:S-adenosylmethionine decarboxylase
MILFYSIPSHWMESQSIGTHILLDIFDVEAVNLNDSDALRLLFSEAIKRGDLTCLQYAQHIFEPQGVTGFFLLSTSHLSFHTYPESNRIYIDLFSCGDMEKTLDSANYILEQFASTKYNIRTLLR